MNLLQMLEWISQSRPVQFVQAQLPFAATMRLFSGSQKALWAAETLASLAVASLTEDEYGVAQRDLCDIFEGLAGLHEVSSLSPPPPSAPITPCSCDKSLQLNSPRQLAPHRLS